MRRVVLLMGLFLAQVTQGQEIDYRQNVLILKFKPEYRNVLLSDGFDLEMLKAAESWLGVEELFYKYPNSQKPVLDSRHAPSYEESMQVDLTLIVEWKYQANVPVIKAVNYLKNLKCFEYVEPAFIQKVFFMPSDELANKQFHLKNVKTLEAFDKDTGSSNITVGVVDTGVDWDHPDLVNKIDYNLADPIDGIDNDGNGLIDDYRGWNFYDGNNDPDETSWSHGTHVAGLIGAETNNEIGVVGTGYNTKILPVKVGNQDRVTHGYEGLQYAADMGCQIINCSWGSTSISSQGQDVVKYVTYNKGVFIVSAAGNNNLDLRFYPACYPEVLNVAGSDSNDVKYDYSNYNYAVDIVAPGRLVFSTVNEGYDVMNGTSMSGPIAAGAAALVRHKFSDFSPMQLLAQLRNTADSAIYFVSGNEAYAEKLGSGLLDMSAALNEVTSPYIRVENDVFTDNDDDVFLPDEIVNVVFDVVNYLNPSNNLTITLRPYDLNNNIQMIDSVLSIGSLTTLGRFRNDSNPFTFKVVDENGPYNQTLAFKVLVTDGNFTTINFIETKLKPDFVNVNVNNIRTTVASNGLFGYTNFFQTNGLGFQHIDFGNLLFEGGLMVGTRESSGKKKVVDQLRSVDVFDRDFTKEIIIDEIDLVDNEAYRASGSFVDTSATKDEIGLEIYQTAIAFSDEGHKDYIILQYNIINRSDSDLEEVYAGLFADWDIANASFNRANTVSTIKLGYAKNAEENEICAGIQLLSSQGFHSYMLDNTPSGDGGVNMNDADNFSTADKFQTLYSNRFESGTSDLGSDVAQVISTTRQTLLKDDTLVVRFALHAAETVEKLVQSAEEAYKRENGFYPGDSIEGESKIWSVYPNPSSGNLNIKIEIKQDSELEIIVRDIQGRLINSQSLGFFYRGLNNVSTDLRTVKDGVYFISLKGSDFEETFSIQKLKY